MARMGLQDCTRRKCSAEGMKGKVQDVTLSMLAYHRVEAGDEHEHQRDLHEQRAHARREVRPSWRHRGRGIGLGLGASGGNAHEVHSAARAAVHGDRPD